MVGFCRYDGMVLKLTGSMVIFGCLVGTMSGVLEYWMMLSSLTLTSKICTPHRAAPPPESLLSVRVRLSLLSIVSLPKSAYCAVGELLWWLVPVVGVIVGLGMIWEG